MLDIVGLIATIALLVGGQLWAALDSARGRWVWLFKPLASLGFIAVALLDGPPRSAYGWTVVAGLVLSAMGDVLLIPKSRRWFVIGLVSFLFAHVAYSAAFASRGLELGVVGATALGLIIVAIPVVRWLWPNVEQEMQVPVAAYMLVISIMVALAAGTVAARGNTWIVVGAVAFFASDIAVAQQRFIGHSFASRAWGLPLYYAAQVALATTVI